MDIVFDLLMMCATVDENLLDAVHGKVLESVFDEGRIREREETL